eukprot:gene26075-34089_t
MSADGHKASDWPTTSIWSGKMKIVEKGKTANIILLDANNQVFAVCPVTDESAVEKTLDSSRYFALRIVNPAGKKAYIGIAFNERNDAFDFNVTLAEHRAMIERENSSFGHVDSNDKTSSLISPLRDLTMKEGEKVTIKISGTNRRERQTSGTSSGLLPPPGSKLTNTSTDKPTTTDPFADDLFTSTTNT